MIVYGAHEIEMVLLYSEVVAIQRSKYLQIRSHLVNKSAFGYIWLIKVKVNVRQQLNEICFAQIILDESHHEINIHHCHEYNFEILTSPLLNTYLK